MNIRYRCDQAYLFTGSDEDFDKEESDKYGKTTEMMSMTFGQLEVPE